jgi:hypothetical protein
MGSEAPQGFGWWQASDGRWYAPEQHADPGYRARFTSPPPPPPPPPRPAPHGAGASTAPTMIAPTMIAPTMTAPTMTAPTTTAATMTAPGSAGGPVAVAPSPASSPSASASSASTAPATPAPVADAAPSAGPWAHTVAPPPATNGGFEPPPIASTPAAATPTASATVPAAPIAPAEARRTGQRWPFVLGAIVLVAVVIGIVGAALSPADEDPDRAGATVTTVATTAVTATGATSPPATTTASSTRAPTTTAPTTSAPTTSAVAARGTKDTPLAIGETATLRDTDNGDIDVTVNGFVADAGAAITAENRFNQAPPAGHQYMLVNVTMTYHAGAKRQSVHGVGIAASMSAFGTSAVELDDFSCNVVVPQRLNAFAEVLDGGTVTGNECVLAPAGDAAGPLLLRFRESLCIANCDEVWFTLQ